MGRENVGRGIKKGEGGGGKGEPWGYRRRGRGRRKEVGKNSEEKRNEKDYYTWTVNDKTSSGT